MSVANQIRLENEHHWADVNTTLVQDDRAFLDFVPAGQFKGAEGDEYDEVRGLIGTVANETFADLFAQFLF